MSGPRKTAIVTGASQGIGAGIVRRFVERGFNVVANSRKVTQSTEVAASNHVALVDGHIGEPATAAQIVETALSRFQSIDVLVNNAGIFFTKPFTDYTAEFGEPYYERVEASATPEQKLALEKLSPEKFRLTDLAGEKIQTLLTHAPGNEVSIGGIKVIANN